MALAVDDVVQVSIRGLLFNQRILTVLHYVVSVAGSGSTETNLENIAADFAGAATAQDVINKYVAATSLDLGLSEIRAQRVFPTRTVYKAFAIARSGGDADNAATANMAASILKQTNTPGRRGIGRMQLAGLPNNAIAAGLLQDAYRLGALTDLANELKKGWSTVTGTAITLQPCLYNPGATPAYSIIVGTVPEITVRTMHRRTVLLGE